MGASKLWKFGGMLPAWEEHRRQYPDQAIGLARVVSRRAMRAFGLTFSEDGRVVARLPEGKLRQSLPPSLSFRLPIKGEELRVE